VAHRSSDTAHEFSASPGATARRCDRVLIVDDICTLMAVCSLREHRVCYKGNIFLEMLDEQFVA
jgi:hypothetical protein